MESPPPSYQHIFPTAPLKEPSIETKHDPQEPHLHPHKIEQANPLEFLRNVEIIPLPVMRELVTSQRSPSSTMQSYKEYMILDGDTGSEILVGNRMTNTTSDRRGLTLNLENGQQLLRCAYLYSPAFSKIEFSFGDGTGLLVFEKEGLGLGLCGCICLCFCCPIATASIKEVTSGQPILLCNSYLFPRKVDIHRPECLGGGFLATVNVQRMNSDSIVKISLGDKCGLNDKVVIVGLALAFMDYERVHRASGGVPFALHDRQVL